MTDKPRPIRADERPTATGPERGGGESALHLLLRLVAIAVGLPLTTVALAAWLGLLIESPWVSLGVATVVAILPTLLLVDRLLPDDDPRKGRGIPTDVLSIVWLGGATLTFGPLAFLLHAPLVSLAERALGEGAAVTIADYLTGVPTNEAGPSELATPSGADDGGLPLDAGTTPAELAAEATPTELDASAGGETDAAVDAAIDAAIDATVDAGSDAGPEAPDAGPAASAEMTPAEVFRTYARSVVSIEVVLAGRGPDGDEPGARAGGTGFVIDARGIIATNHHVIGRARSVRVKLLDGTFADGVTLLVDDPAHDLALLEIRTTHPLHAVRLGDSDRVQVGERAVVIGNPLGLEHTLSDGIVSARRRIEDHNMIQMTAPVSPGNSGGPVFDGHGEVIGVTTAVIGIGLGQNLNLAVPVNQLRTLVRDEYPERRGFGETPDPTGRGGHW